jgi:hypothetical protein
MSSPALDDHAKAIGYLCMQFALLEITMEQLIAHLVPIPNGKVSLILANADIRGKQKMLRGLGHIHKPSTRWFEILDEQLRALDGYILLRNRFIHDAWTTGPKFEPMRMERTTKIRRPQAHKPPELITNENIPVTADEIWSLVQKVTHSSVQIGFLRAGLDLGEPDGLLPPLREKPK